MKQTGAQQLRAQVEAYFASCDATTERFEQKNGAIAYRQVPYTLAGLSAATARSEQSIRSAVEGQGGRAEREIFADAMRRIARHLWERALMGELQTSVAMTLIRQLGTSAPEENGGEDRRLTVVLDDREGWSD